MARSKLQVLVVEDNPADALKVRDDLARRGGGAFRTTVVGGMKEAASRLPEADVVVLDLSLPDGEGADNVTRVRASAPRVPIVVLSGSRDDDLAFRCLQHGAQDVLVKGTVDADALVRALQCALERQALAAERDEAHARARAEEESLRAVLTVSREGVVVSDPAGRVLFVNPAGADLLGWIPGEGVGRPSNLPLESAEPVELERRGPDGKVRTLEVRSSVVTWEGVPAVLAMLHDLTPRKSAERGRRRIEEQRREVEWLGTLGRLAGGVAHGLNNQLSVVLGFDSLIMERQDLPESVLVNARRVQEAGWRAADLVKQLMACAGKLSAIPEILDLNRLLTGLDARIAQCLTGGVHVRWELAPGSLSVRADPRLLEQAVFIMVEHARDSMPGGGTLTIATTREDPDPGVTDGGGGAGRPRAVLTVTDTGPGLTNEARRRLFEPFYTSEVLGIGSGLGMAPVYGIAMQCGGKAEAENALGRGTIVRLTLPASEDEAIPRALPVPAGTDTVSDALPGGSETVLIVEEDPECRSMIAASLRELGYNVHCAANAGDAVRLAASLPPLALLVAENRAAGMRGPVLAKVLRCRKPGLRALVLATQAESSGGEDGADQRDIYLSKPFGRRELALKVRRVLDRT